MADSLDVVSEKVDTLGRRVNDHSRRIDKVEQEQTGQGKEIEGICKYQEKQNGSLLRLEGRFNGFYNMLFVAILGLLANIVLTVLMRVM